MIGQLKPEPCATEPGKLYRVWLQFRNHKGIGEPATNPLHKPMDEKAVSKAHAATVEWLMENQPAAMIEDMGLVLAIHHLELFDTTAYVWVSEV